MNKRFPLSYQLVATMVLLAIILAYLFGILVEHLATNRVQQEFVENNINRLKLFSEILNDDAIINDQKELRTTVEKLAKFNPNLIELKVIDRNKQLLVNWSRPNFSNELDTVLLTENLSDSDQHFGELQILWSKSDVVTEINRRVDLTRKLIFLLLLLMILPVFLWVKWLILRPLKHINRRLAIFATHKSLPPIKRKEWAAQEFINLENTIDRLDTEIQARQKAEKQLKLAKEEATEANQTKSLFLANMSHELRTPLNAIIGYAELLEDQYHENNHKMEIQDLKKIQSAGTHLLALINSVLDLSKIEAGKISLVIENVDIRKLATEVSNMVQPLLAKTKNHLEFKCHKSIGNFFTDITRLRQIIYNLLSNAAKFTENGLITFTIKREITSEGEFIIFVVTDTGIGISETQIGQLFQVFSQADESITRKYGGTGLGLAICKKLCQEMGGTISVTSELGHGSTFTVSFLAKEA